MPFLPPTRAIGRAIALGVFLFAVSWALAGQSPSAAAAATDEELTAAVAVGRDQRVESRFLAHCSARAGFRERVARNLVGGGGLQPTGGFEVNALNHLGMIAYTAQEHARTYKPFSLENVTGEMRRPSITVSVMPDSRTQWDETQAPIQNIVLRSRSRNEVVVQPTNIDSGSSGGDLAAFGIFGSVYRATFPFDEVVGLPDGDIEVILVTTAGERKCTLDDDDREKLHAQ